MQFRIADTFTDSLAKLNGDEQKAAKISTFDLQANPSNPGLKFHKLDRARDKQFWSVRVSRDIRIIVHKTNSSLLLCYVGHHDDAYHWAERRKLETHPKTGAAQIVEVREKVQKIVVPEYVGAETQNQPDTYVLKPPVLSHMVAEDLLNYGVPGEWVDDLLTADEDHLLELADHLPAEAAEALLELAIGGTPDLPVLAEEVDPFEHPDAQRRFRVVDDRDELELALDYPWEKWTIFLHPTQRDLVEKDYSGPARVSGSAGTGKTVVALHRAVYLADQDRDARVLLTTFSDALANSLRVKLRRLIRNKPRLAERLEIHSITFIGRKLYETRHGKANIASKSEISSVISQAAKKVEGNKFSEVFLESEWIEIVDAWQLGSWESYRDVLRLGRKIRLPEPQRKILWSIFEQVRAELKDAGLITWSELFNQLSIDVSTRNSPVFDYAIVDEAQDISVAQLRFLAALGGERPNSLFFAGDLGQRIFQAPFSWKALGVDIRGRSHTLRINYRTSHQIRKHSDRLLGPKSTDVDGNVEDRSHTVSVFNGPAPVVQVANDETEESKIVGDWLAGCIERGVQESEIGIFIRSRMELGRAVNAVESAGLDYVVLDNNFETVSSHVSISTMHLAKGLEFRAVVVMACDDEIIPSQQRVETANDGSDLEEIYNTERHLLYVACTRARDYLLVTGVDPASEFLEDFLQKYDGRN